MSQSFRSEKLVRIALGCALACGAMKTTHAADVVRHSLGPNSNFPIAGGVEVRAGATIIFHSGRTPAPPRPSDRGAAPGPKHTTGRTRESARLP